MCEVTSTTVTSDDKAWTQASLPVKFGGLGVRSAVEVAPSAYLASLRVTSVLVEAMLLVAFPSSKPCLLGGVLLHWLEGHDQPSMSVGDLNQNSWDQLMALATASQLVEGAVNDTDKACWLASSTKESGAWLHALSISAL